MASRHSYPAECMLMEAASLQRQQIIASLLAPQPEHIADVAVSHWEKLAASRTRVADSRRIRVYRRRLWTDRSARSLGIARSLSPGSGLAGYGYAASCHGRQYIGA